MGTDFSPYCVTGMAWMRLGLDGGLQLPVPPGRGRPWVFCQDRAGNGSPRTNAGLVAVNVPGGSPPPPFWRLADGGAAPADLWTNDTYLSRLTFPGTATMRYSMIEHRVEDAGWDGIAIVTSRTRRRSRACSTSAAAATAGCRARGRCWPCWPGPCALGGAES